MRRAIQLVTLIILLALARQWTGNDSGQQVTPRGTPVPSTSNSPEQADVLVHRVVDGDTLLLEGGERVRLLGVDTPETKKPDTPVQPFGPEASAFTTQMVEGKIVTLVFDRERFDKYHRTLAFVYLGNICLNEELIRQGLSAAQLQYPYRSDMKRRFSAAEAEARSKRIGIWSLSTKSPHPIPRRQTPVPAAPVQSPELQNAADPTLRFE